MKSKAKTTVFLSPNDMICKSDHFALAIKLKVPYRMFQNKDTIKEDAFKIKLDEIEKDLNKLKHHSNQIH